MTKVYPLTGTDLETGGLTTSSLGALSTYAEIISNDDPLVKYVIQI